MNKDYFEDLFNVVDEIVLAISLFEKDEDLCLDHVINAQCLLNRYIFIANKERSLK